MPARMRMVLPLLPALYRGVSGARFGARWGVVWHFAALSGFSHVRAFVLVRAVLLPPNRADHPIPECFLNAGGFRPWQTGACHHDGDEPGNRGGESQSDRAVPNN